MTLLTVFMQMLALLIMMSVGVIAAKTKMLDAHTNTHVSRMIVNIFNPVLVLSGAVNSVGQVPLERLGMVFLIAIGMFLAFILIGMVLSPFFDKDAFQRKAFQLMFVFSNLGFIGIPVVSSVLGTEFVVYVSEFILIYNVVFYTYAVALMKGRFRLSSLRSMLSPGNLFCVIALLVLLLNIQLPGFLVTSITYIGGAASPLALAAVGYTLANANLREIFTDKRLYAFTLVKLLIIPCIFLPILRLLPIEDALVAVCMVMFGMPVGNMPLLLINQEGKDSVTYTAAILMTTIACVFTVPILMSLI